MIEGELKDALSELINISYGSATAAIADLFDNFATLQVPDITIVPANQIFSVVMERGEEKSLYVTTQQFKGAFEGEILFVINHQSAANMQSVICEEGIFGETDTCQDDQEVQQSILEISNILGSSCIGKLAELLESGVTFFPPTIDSGDQLLAGLDKTFYDQVIIISTLLNFEETQIKGHLFILFTDEVFECLKHSLEAFWEDNT